MDRPPPPRDGSPPAKRARLAVEGDSEPDLPGVAAHLPPVPMSEPAAAAERLEQQAAAAEAAHAAYLVSYAAMEAGHAARTAAIRASAAALRAEEQLRCALQATEERLPAAHRLWRRAEADVAARRGVDADALLGGAPPSDRLAFLSKLEGSAHASYEGLYRSRHYLRARLGLEAPQEDAAPEAAGGAAMELDAAPPGAAPEAAEGAVTELS